MRSSQLAADLALCSHSDAQPQAIAVRAALPPADNLNRATGLRFGAARQHGDERWEDPRGGAGLGPAGRRGGPTWNAAPASRTPLEAPKANAIAERFAGFSYQWTARPAQPFSLVPAPLMMRSGEAFPAAPEAYAVTLSGLPLLQT